MVHSGLLTSCAGTKETKETKEAHRQGRASPAKLTSPAQPGAAVPLAFVVWLVSGWCLALVRKKRKRRKKPTGKARLSVSETAIRAIAHSPPRPRRSDTGPVRAHWLTAPEAHRAPIDSRGCQAAPLVDGEPGQATGAARAVSLAGGLLTSCAGTKETKEAHRQGRASETAICAR
jgi:hypothetical protein